jgi:hypothetical protein
MSETTPAPAWIDDCPGYLQELHSYLTQAQIIQLNELLSAAKANGRGVVALAIYDGKPQYWTLEVKFSVRKDG